MHWEILNIFLNYRQRNNESSFKIKTIMIIKTLIYQHLEYDKNCFQELS